MVIPFPPVTLTGMWVSLFPDFLDLDLYAYLKSVGIQIWEITYPILNEGHIELSLLPPFQYIIPQFT